ncbi:MAG: bifunctional transcriptional activator/DNA repair enzyme AdaA [Kiloniellales bacterium]
MVGNIRQCWQAVVGRDPRADGQFVYAAVTTGIYCRPSCPTPTPLRRNVRFFADSMAAERAGFRECKRCRPTLDLARAPHLGAIGRACAILRTSERPPSVAALAAAVGMSRFHFQRVFRETLGITPGDYAKEERLGRFVQRLEAGQPVGHAIYAAGYGSTSRAYERARETLGMTPAVRRAGGAGCRVRFASAGCVMGQVLIAATGEGVCAIGLGDAPTELEQELRRQLPAAEIGRGDTDFAARVADVVRRVELPLGLPPDVRGTAYRARLRKALRQSPALWSPGSGDGAFRSGSARAAIAAVRPESAVAARAG